MATKKITTSRQTNKRASTAAARTLRNPKATRAGKAAAGSALSQTGRKAHTGEGAASAAGRALSRSVTSPEGLRAAGSALAQAPRKAAKKVTTVTKKAAKKATKATKKPKAR